MVSLTVREAIRAAAEKLRSAGIVPAYFEARQLMSGLTSGDPSLPLAGDRELDTEHLRLFEQRIERRIVGEPLQYILGVWEFYSLPFRVGHGVLIPRPDTELLVDLALEFLKRRPHASVADLCTGSGCVAIAVAKNVPTATVAAFELSDDAIAYFEQNRSLNSADVKLIKADVLDYRGGEKFDLILSNPPYIPSGEIGGLDREVGFEPRMALDGGSDGLTFYRAIAEKWTKSLNPGGAVMVEIGIGEENEAAEIFRKAGLEKIAAHKDINGINRVMTCIKSE